MPVEADVPCFCKYLSACIVRWVREVDFDRHLRGCTSFKIPFHIAPDTLPLKELDAPQRSLLTCECHAQRASYIVRVGRSEVYRYIYEKCKGGGRLEGPQVMLRVHTWLQRLLCYSSVDNHLRYVVKQVKRWSSPLWLACRHLCTPFFSVIFFFPSFFALQVRVFSKALVPENPWFCVWSPARLGEARRHFLRLAECFHRMDKIIGHNSSSV